MGGVSPFKTFIDNNPVLTNRKMDNVKLYIGFGAYVLDLIDNIDFPFYEIL